MNPRSGRDVSGSVFGEPLSNEGVSVLRDGGSGNLASSNCPNGFVGNDHVGPRLDGGLDCVELCLEDIISLSSLPLFERLTDTEDNLKAGGVSTPNLLSNDFICFTEEFTALRVTNEGPLKAKVDDLLRADFTSESTVSFGADVLGGD